MKLSLRWFYWKRSFRIIPTREPTIHVFERIAPSGDFDFLYELEGMTNARLRQKKGEIDLIAGLQAKSRDASSHNFSSYVMAPFTHLNPSRFSDGTWGVYYAAKVLQTAIAETKYHRSRFLAATQEPPMSLPMRVIEASIKGKFYDLRQSREKNIFDPDSYSDSQKFARQIVQEKSNGIVYKSVRDRNQGECVAAFHPSVIGGAKLTDHLMYQWDGKMIANVYKLEKI